MSDGVSVGIVSGLDGAVRIETGEGSGALRPGDRLFPGDTIKTGDGGEVELTFIDGTVISIGSNSELVIAEYEFDPEDPAGNGGLYRMQRGIFTVKTGRMSLGERDVTVESPLALVKISGTTTIHEINENMERLGIVSLTAGEQVEVKDVFGSVQVVDVPGIVLEMSAGAGIREAGPLNMEMRGELREMGVILSEVEEDEGDEGQPQYPQSLDPDYAWSPNEDAPGYGTDGSFGQSSGEILFSVAGFPGLQEKVAATDRMMADRFPPAGVNNGDDDDFQIPDGEEAGGEEDATTGGNPGGGGSGGGGSGGGGSGGSGSAEIVGTEGDDVLQGTAEVDTIKGLGGNDVIEGGAKADFLYGGSGDDRFVFNAGDVEAGEEIDGGDGNDSLHVETNSANFSAAVLASIENLVLDADQSAEFSAAQLDGAAWEVFGNAGGAETLIISGSASGDAVDLSGLALNSWSGGDKVALGGGDGDDTLTGTVGDDSIEGGSGTDSMDGGGGTDTLSFAAAPAGVIVDLSLAQEVTDDGYGNAENADNFEHVTGSAHADRISGDAGANRVEAGAGDDELELFGGLDTILGGDGDDTFTLNLDNPQGILDGGPGTGDFLIMDAAAMGGANADLTGMSALDGVEFLTLNSAKMSLASSLVDPNWRFSMNADAGLGVADITMDSPALDLSSWDFGLNPAARAYFAEVTGTAANETITGASADVNGDGGDDRLLGEGGDDYLDGDSGEDTLQGGAGNDCITGGSGTDSMDGGGGTDTLSFASAPDKVKVDLSQAAEVVDDGYGNAENADSFEVFVGGDHDDTLVGNYADQTLYGGNGHDSIVGADGAGNRTVIFGGPGVDIIIGGTGEDWLCYDEYGLDNNDSVGSFNNVEGDRLRFDKDAFASLFEANDFQTGTLDADLFFAGSQPRYTHTLNTTLAAFVLFDTTGARRGRLYYDTKPSASIEGIHTIATIYDSMGVAASLSEADIYLF